MSQTSHQESTEDVFNPIEEPTWAWEDNNVRMNTCSLQNQKMMNLMESKLRKDQKGDSPIQPKRPPSAKKSAQEPVLPQSGGKGLTDEQIITNYVRQSAFVDTKKMAGPLLEVFVIVVLIQSPFGT